MNKRQYADLMESISFSISSVLNENNIDSKEKSMYEQDKLENETWKQMADRVGFTTWYKQLGRTPKDIGNSYMKARQRWLANSCKDPKIINKAIENYEELIDNFFLGDDSYVSTQNNKEDLKELKQYIKKLENKIDLLQNALNISEGLNVSTLNVSKLLDDIRNAISKEIDPYHNYFKGLMECILDKQLSMLYVDMSGGSFTRYGIYYQSKRRRYKILLVTGHYYEKDEKRAITEAINNKYHTDYTINDIFFLRLNEGFHGEYDNLLYRNIDLAKKIGNMIQNGLRIELFYKTLTFEYEKQNGETTQLSKDDTAYIIKLGY